MKSTTERLRIALTLNTLTEAELASTIAAIQKVAPTSALMQNASISSSVTALGKKGATLSSAVATVAADEQQLRLDMTARAAARTAVENELDTLRTLVANNATSDGDITGMGFVPLSLPAQTRTVPNPPAQIITRLGKVHGKARVVVEGVKSGHFVAEMTPDPISATSVWTSLPGNGRQRTVTGATGSKVWVRFAQVRYGLQSDWSVPVLVTLP